MGLLERLEYPHRHAQRLVRGARVRLTAPSPKLRLRVTTGTVVGPAAWDDRLFLIRLDQPGAWIWPNGQSETVAEVYEAIEYLDVIS